jgi:hypothetical protein
VFSNSTPRKCPLCSKLSSSVKNLFSALIGNKLNCQQINEETVNKAKQRVAEINKAAPDCSCEKYRMSIFSPSVVGDEETLARFVFSPIHVDKKKGIIKPSIFSHVYSAGCSIQRETIATSEELIDFAKNFLEPDPNRAWEGVLLATCNDVREIKAADAKSRALCVYDTRRFSR